MVKKLSKKSLLWISAVSLVLCVALVVGIVAMAIVGGGALNRITTANLGLELWKHNGTEYVNVSNGSGDIFSGGKNGIVWEPGKTEVVFLQVKNPTENNVSFNLLQEVQPQKGAPALSGLSYAVLSDMTSESYAEANFTNWKAIQKAAEAQGSVALGSTATNSDVYLAAGESAYFALAVHMDDKAEAAYEGVTIDVKLSGRQLGGENENQTVFYVSPTGHDGNPGTEKEPLKTFRRAAQLAKPGQTYIFEDGTYNEGGMTIMMNSGTEEEPIVFKARNAGKAKVIYPESLCGTDKIQIFSKEYITIEGFDITQAVAATAEHPNAKMDVIIRCPSSNNITFRNLTISNALEEPLKVNRSNGILIEGCHIYNSGNEGIDFVDVSDSIVRNCVIEEVGRCALMCKGGSRSNLFYGNVIRNKTKTAEKALEAGGATDNVSTWGCTTNHWEAFNIMMFNNVIIAENQGGFSYGLGFMGAKDCAAFNNVVIGCNYGVQYDNPNNIATQWEWDPTNDNNTVVNNIIMNSTLGAVKMMDINNNLTSDYNLYYNNAGTDPKEDHSIYGKDPMFIASKSDWHLQKESPAVGAGTALGDMEGYSGQKFTIGFDKDYTIRGGTWDIGVYDMDGADKYEPGGLVFQDPAFRRPIDHTIFEAPEIGSMPELGTVLAEHNFDSATGIDGWTECVRSKGQWTIKNGMMAMTPATLEGHAIITLSDGYEWSDYEFTAKVMAPSGKGPSSGLIFRADEAMENMYGFRFYPESAGDKMEFCMWNNDKFSSIETFDFKWTASQFYVLKVVAVGGDFEFYVNGEKVHTAKDGSHATGSAGLYSYKESRMYDDVVATSARGYQVVHLENKERVPEYTGRVLLEETFDNADALKNWKVYSGENWRVEGGHLTCDTGIPGENIIIYDKGYNWVNYEFTADIRQPETGGMWAGLVWRANDTKTGYFGFRFVNDNLQVVKGWPGNWSQIGIKAMSSLPKGEVAQLKVIMEDQTFRLFLNGRKVWEDDDRMNVKGSIGLFQQNMTEIIFDNVLVKEIVSDGITPEEPETPSDTPKGQVVLSENFSNANSANKWMSLATETGKFEFKNGKLQYTQIHDEDGSTTTYMDGYWKNFTVTFKANLSAASKDGNWLRVNLRTADGSDGYYAYFLNTSNGEFVRICSAKESKPLREQYGASISALFDGKDHDIKIAVNGSTIEVSIDNIVVATATNDKIKATPGSIGFASFNHNWGIDNLKVYCEDKPLLKKPTVENVKDDYKPTGTLVLDEKFDAASGKWQDLETTNGKYTYENGKLVYTQLHKSNGSKALYAPGYWKDFTVMFDATLPRTDADSSWMRIALRTADGADGPYVYFQNLSRDFLAIRVGDEIIKETYGGKVSAAFDGKEHKIRISVARNKISVFIDGEEVMSAEDDLIAQNPGTIAFYTFGNGYAIDNLKVYCQDNPLLVKPEQDDPVVPSDPSTEVIEGTEVVGSDMQNSFLDNWEVKTQGGGYKYNAASGAVQYEAPQFSLFYKKGNWTNYTVTFKTTAPVSSSNGNWLRLYQRTTDGKSGISIYLRNLGTDDLRIMNGDTEMKKTSASVAEGFFDGKEHFVKIVVADNTISMYIDGNLAITATDDAIAATPGSISFVSQSYGYTFKELKVYNQDEGAGNDPSTPPVQPVEDILLEEDFTDELDSNWVEGGGQKFYVDTTNGVLTMDGSTSGASQIWYKGLGSALWTDYDITFKMSAPSENGCWNGVLFRAQENLSNYYYFRLLNGNVQFGTKSGAISTNGSGIAKDGNVHDVKICVRGGNITIYVDEVLRVSATNTTIAAGSIGFYAENCNPTYDDLKVVNKGEPISLTTDFTVNANFNDGNDTASRPASIEVTLYADGVATEKVGTLTAANNYQFTFEDLDVYNAQEEKIQYTIAQPTVNGYMVTMSDGKVINLTPVFNYEGTLIWNDAANQDGKRPANVSVTLCLNGSPMLSGEQTVSGTGDSWAFSYDNLPKYVDNQLANYSVMVFGLPSGYTASANGGNVTLTYVPGNITVSLSINWADADDFDGIRPDSVQVTVIGTVGASEVYNQKVTLTAADSWQGSVNVPEKSGGELITYTVDVAAADLPAQYNVVIVDNVVTLTHIPTTLLLNENFDDASKISDWSQVATNGSIGIADGKLKVTKVGQYGNYIYYTPGLSWTDYDVSATFNTEGSTWQGLLARANANRDAYHVRLLNGKVFFYKFIGGSYTASGATMKEIGSYTKGNSVDLRMTVVGNVITIYKDGTELYTYTDTTVNPITTGTVGFMNSQNDTPAYDYIKVVNLNQ